MQDYSVGEGHLQQMMQGKPDLHLQENQGGPLPHTTYKKETKMHHRSQHMGENHGTQENTVGKSVNRFLHRTPSYEQLWHSTCQRGDADSH